MKRLSLITSLIVLSTSAMTVASGAEARRDPALWPFDAASPWNVAIGDKARFVTIDARQFDPAVGGGINCRQWSHPIYIATAHDPLVRIDQQDPRQPRITIRVPAAAMPDSKSDGHLHIIDETHSFVVEMWQAKRSPDGLITAVAVKNDLRGPGVYDGWHGVRAYGGSAIAGLIRRGELTDGIHHALAAAVYPKAHNASGPNGQPFVWPASSADGDAATAYSTTGNLYMGSLVAIPPTVDLSKLSLRGPERVLAQALQDYGAYIVDSAHSNFVLFAEPPAQSEVSQIRTEAMQALVAQLKIVANNGPKSIGGGGHPRRPPAAPMSAYGQPAVD
jgi:hypothetical protein